MKRGRLLVFLGSLGLLIGALLPWVSITSIFGTVSKAGYESDGLLTGGIGLLLLIGSVTRRGKPGRTYSIASAVFALLAGAIAAWDLCNVTTKIADVGNENLIASIGTGLFVTLLGALLAFIGGWLIVPETPTQTADLED